AINKAGSTDFAAVTKALRANEATQSIPIMAVTCLTKEKDIERIFLCGADEYLAKPFKIDDLLKKVRDLAGREHAVE
ncbi:MAG TPA: response regulator, partial [Candidatus Hydrogenedentes bacterium]|nr:response regulator [Candidatus Hydrogenedentota bacterium]